MQIHPQVYRVLRPLRHLPLHLPDLRAWRVARGILPALCDSRRNVIAESREKPSGRPPVVCFRLLNRPVDNYIYDLPFQVYRVLRALRHESLHLPDLRAGRVARGVLPALSNSRGNLHAEQARGQLRVWPGREGLWGPIWRGSRQSPNGHLRSFLCAGEQAESGRTEHSGDLYLGSMHSEHA